MKTLSVRFATPVAALFALFAAGCGGDTASPIPTQPSVILRPPAPALAPAPGPGPSGRPIAVGEIVTGAITSSDAVCSLPDPAEPDEEIEGYCQRFVVAAPGDGTLAVRVDWHGASDFLFLAAGPNLSACCGSPLLVRARVGAGSSYTLDVVRSGGAGGGTHGMPFELTTSFDRN